MLFSRSLQLLQRQPVRATQVRSYTTEGEEKDSVAKLRKDMQESLDAFEKTRLPDIPSKDAILRQRDSQKADYKVLHDTINSTETDYDPFDKDFYALSPAQQDAVRTWRSAYDAQIAPLSDKHGSALSRGLARVNTLIAEADAPMQEPVVVAITGAAGNIGYSALFRLASGGVFGPKVPVVLRLLELPGALGALEGVVMELNDCAFPTLKSVVTTSDAEEAFSGVDYALLVGAQPRTKGMERGDLLSANAEIFSAQGKALKKSKGADTRVIVVGNPANTNALIASANASTVPAKNFVAMTRLDHNRGLAQIAAKASVEVDEIDRFVIWGNHSATQFPDVTHAVINKNGNWQEASSLLDAQWLSGNFIPTVQKRGAEIIAARGASSAASAGSSALDQLRDWHFGTNNKWTSAAVVSSGEYGVEEGLFYSYPVVFNSEKEWDIVRHLPITPAAAKLMEATHQELIAERDAISHLLPK